MAGPGRAGPHLVGNDTFRWVHNRLLIFKSDIGLALSEPAGVLSLPHLRRVRGMTRRDHRVTQQEQQEQRQQVEQQLRRNWQRLRYRILDQFNQVSSADLDAATGIDDLVARIADRTHHSEQYVENRLRHLTGVGTGQQGQAFGTQQ